MAHGKTGKAAVVTVAGTSLIKLTEWTSEVTVEEVNDTGAGDTVRSRTPTIGDWTFTAKAIEPSTGASLLGALVGTEIAVVGKDDSGVTAFAATGLCTKVGRQVPFDGNIVRDIEVKAAGAAPSTY